LHAISDSPTQVAAYVRLSRSGIDPVFSDRRRTNRRVPAAHHSEQCAQRVGAAGRYVAAEPSRRQAIELEVSTGTRVGVAGVRMDRRTVPWTRATDRAVSIEGEV
jgi:hypothetical protein